MGVRNLGLEMGRFPGKKLVMRVLAAASCFSHWTLMFPGEGARPKEDYAMSLATPEASSALGQLKSLQVPVPTVAPVPPTPTAKETVGSSQTPVLEGLPPLLPLDRAVLLLGGQLGSCPGQGWGSRGGVGCRVRPFWII